MPDRSRRMVRVLADGVAITVAATLATAPLLAHHFGAVPAGGPAGEPPRAAGGRAGHVARDGQGGARPARAWPARRGARQRAGGGRAGLPRLAGRALRRSARGAVEPDASGRRPQVLGAYLAIARRRVRARTGRPSRAGGPPRGRGALAAPVPVQAASPPRLRWSCSSAGATAAALERPRPPDRLTIRFLDVGQGDATLIQYPDGTAVLFDGGPPEAGVARLLRRAGVRRLDAVVATHASRDHHGGLLDVLRRFAVGLLVDGGDGTADPALPCGAEGGGGPSHPACARDPRRSGSAWPAGGC